MIALETERLILRNYMDEDTDDVFAYFSRHEVAEFEDFYPMSATEVRDLIEEWQNRDNRMVAVLKETDTVVGSIGYWIDEDNDYSIDFDFNPDYWKKGYAAEAAGELLRYLFESVGIDRLYGDCDVRNKNSCRLMEKLGFRKIDRLDDASYKNDPQGNPILISIYIYLLGRDEWLTGRPS